MDGKTTRIVREAVLEALELPEDERPRWIAQKCAGDARSVELLRELVTQVGDSGDSSFLAPGGALEGAIWDRLARTLSEEPQLAPGLTVGRYVVLEEVGAGGMGVVFAAWDPELDRKVALKLLHSDTFRSGESEDRLRREAQAMARLSHPNVVAVHDVGSWEGQVFVAMEFVEGQHLAAWREARKRSWREIVDIYRRAGRGLAAAHAAGLVHRDFKPQNVLLGRDGRVRVLDFGLARSVESQAREEATPEPLGASPLPDLTREGSVAGTPAYMAPEQLAGEDPDPRSDQFSFCAALYRALWGEIPFPARSALDLLRLYALKKEPETPAQPPVPKWLRRVVLRGLSLEPERRWPDMDSLLEALGRDPARQRARWSAVAAVVLLAALGWIAFRPSGEALCQGAEARLAGVWDLSRSAELEGAFGASATPRAEPLFARTREILGDYARGWVAQRTEACEATHLRGEQSAELLDLRMACLDRRRDELAALVDLLAAGGEEVVERAPEAALGLEPLATCADAELLKAPVARPRDPETVRELEAVETRLAAVKAGVDAGREAATREEAERAVSESARLGFSPLEAEARFVLADLVERLGEFDAAAEEAFRSWTAAERGDHEKYKVRALSLLVWVDGNDRARFGEAERWAALGEATLERLGGGGILEAELHNNLGAALQSAGRAPEALEHHRRALELRRELLGDESYDVAKSLNNVGSALYTEARFGEALDYYRQSLELLERILGDHPATAMAHSNVGAAYVELRNAEEARTSHAWALEMRRELFGDESFWVGISELNLAFSDLIDRPAEALPHIDTATRILGATLPVDHPYQAYPLSLRGRYLLETGRLREAAGELSRALKIWEASGAALPYELAGDRFQLARALESSEPERALGLARESLELLENTYSVDSPLQRDLAAWLAEHDG